MPPRPTELDLGLMKDCATDTAALAESVHAEQKRRLRTTLEYARSCSRFYRKRLRELSGAALASGDTTALPFTHPEDLSAWKQFLCISQDGVERLVTLETSGTSGPPKRLAFSAKDLEATKNFFRTGMAQITRKGDRVLSLLPGTHRPHGVYALLREALGKVGVSVFAGCSRADAADLRRDMGAHNPHVVVAAPGQLTLLAELLSENPPAKKRALRGILSSADILPPELAHTLQTHYGILTLDHYGMTETGYGGGVECPAHDGYHLRELDLLFEIVDMESGEPLPDGEEGELVVTTLTREAMPLIRYKTGDAASMLSGPCRCGSPLRRLSRIRGRIARRRGVHVEHMPKGGFHERTSAPAL